MTDLKKILQKFNTPILAAIIKGYLNQLEDMKSDNRKDWEQIDFAMKKFEKDLTSVHKEIEELIDYLNKKKSRSVNNISPGRR